MNNKIKHFLIFTLFFFTSNVIANRNIYAVIVGVANYKYNHLKLDLQYPDNDAQLFYKLLREAGVRKENIVLLTNNQASKNNVISSLNHVFTLAQASDEIIFYFSGHGTNGYFAPYDYNGNFKSLISFTNIKRAFKKSKAQKKICIADACFSGSIKKNNTNKYNAKSTFKKSKSVIVMMSSRKSQISIESTALKHGIFTFYLVKGLRGKADFNKDKVITVSEMYYYTKSKVSKITQNKQVPIVFGKFDKDLAILKLND